MKDLRSDSHDLATSTSRLVLVTGRVVQESPRGGVARGICMRVAAAAAADDDQWNQHKKCTEIRVQLDGETFLGNIIWLSVKGAKQLICPGVTLRIQGMLASDISDNASPCEIVARRIEIISVLPIPPYLSKLFSFPIEILHHMFPRGREDTLLLSILPPDLVRALAPCNEEYCLAVFRFCQSERTAGRASILWKTRELFQISVTLQEYQNPGKSSSKRPLPPRTGKIMWEALERMEKRWCRDADGPQDEYAFCPEFYTYTSTTTKGSSQEDKHHRNSHNGPLIYGEVDVDPSHNLPDVSDERRQRYIDERKRPQIECMVRLIHQLVDRVTEEDSSEGKKKMYYLADIGGGRGYLAIALAAYFANTPHYDVHITVIDHNESSLAAGRLAAAAANLTTAMSFQLCNVSDVAHMARLHQEHNIFDVVYGLHCCGGLAEAAVEIAIAYRAAFCVSTCCFRSNSELASLTRLATKLVQSTTVAQHEEDCSLVSTLATRVGGRGQHRAIRAYNAMRLVAAEKAIDSRIEKEYQCPGDRRRLQTFQEVFPVEFSAQNRVLMGTFE
jgi:hypothetical protein